ncbi:ATP-dependent DNA ligase [Streptomyces sp. NPDC048639]|uniref:ATP-dependent DNA ligase n=1 Tax=Streptomyces sp. NPDC048639 TaxID=3365581 RepID=UPI00371B7AE1
MVLVPPIEPMLATATDALPAPSALPGGLALEPKYDGFRLMVFRTGGTTQLLSRVGKRLDDAFPEITEAAAALPEDVVLDGEVVIMVDGKLQFGALQQRVNRAPHTARRLAHVQPAHYVVFDLLQRGTTELLHEPYRVRRAALEDLFTRHDLTAPWTLTPVTSDREQAEQWLTLWTPVGVEGVVAKGWDQPYRPGRRGWFKVRARETSEAIVAAVTGPVAAPDTVLLGRYDQGGTLRLAARSTPLTPALREDLGHLLTVAGSTHPWAHAHIAASWGRSEELEFTPVEPEQVMEFLGDVAVDAGRWRHAVRALRLRADIEPGDVPPFGDGHSAGAGPARLRG